MIKFKVLPLPDNKWIKAILKQASGAHIPVFMKDNLMQGYKGRLLKDYPGNQAFWQVKILKVLMNTVNKVGNHRKPCVTKNSPGAWFGNHPKDIWGLFLTHFVKFLKKIY